MSAIPSRTRSLRKPGDNGTSRYGRPGADSNQATTQPEEPRGIPRSTQSPSRLPTARPSRPLSMSGRPPSANDSTTMRPPAPKSNTSKPLTTGLQRSSSNRVSNASSSINPEPVKQDRSRPPLTTSRHLRNPSASSISLTSSTRAPVQGHSRTKSTSSTLLSASTILRPARPADEPPTQPTARSTAADPQLRKPAFATYQQHFSPAKNLGPKPLTAAYLAPPSPSKLPANIARSAETARLQNELLQLHLLHKDAGKVGTEWRSSAKRKLGERFSAVLEKNDELIQLEVEETAKINAGALKEWQDIGRPGWELGEKIQVLDEIVTGVWNLGEPGGKYAKVVRRFERWLKRCQDTLKAREMHEVDDEAVFIEELDGAWKDDCQVLGRKLEGWRAHLRDLGDVEGGSSLAKMVEGIGRLVKGMLLDLSVMEGIERDAMSMERDWIKSSIHDDDDDDENIPTAGAIWRTK